MGCPFFIVREDWGFLHATSANLIRQNRPGLNTGQPIRSLAKSKGFLIGVSAASPHRLSREKGSAKSLSNLLGLLRIRLPHRSIRILLWRRRFLDGRRHRLGGCAQAILRWQSSLDSHHELHSSLMPETFKWKPAARA